VIKRSEPAEQKAITPRKKTETTPFIPSSSRRIFLPSPIIGRHFGIGNR
jgi:hypothetical protein